MNDCPIGLICELMVCQRSMCNQWARAWLIPFLLTGWHPGIGICPEYLLVMIPQYEDDACETDWECSQQEEYNHWVRVQREALFLAGYWNAIELPYSYKNGALYVDFRLVLDWNTAFYCPYPSSYDYSEGFHPAIELEAIEGVYRKYRDMNLDELGFWDDPIWFN